MDARSDEFTSFEAFEREYLPNRHAKKKGDGELHAAQLTSDLVRSSLERVRSAVEGKAASGT